MERQQKISINLAVYCWVIIAAGCDYSSQSITAVSYLQQLHVSRVSLIHGVLFVVRPLVGYSLGLWIGRACDKYRCGRPLLVITTFWGALGSFIYAAIPSVYALLVGRIFVGFFVGAFAIINGELARTVEHSKMLSTFSILNVANCVGLIFGTVVCLLTADVDFKAFNFEVKYTNVPAFVSCALYFSALIFAWLCCYNSNEVGPPPSVVEEIEKKNLLSDDEVNSTEFNKSSKCHSSILNSFKALLSNNNVLLLNVCTFVYNWISRGSIALVPLVGVFLFDFSINRIAAACLLGSIGYLLLSVTCSLLAKHVSEYAILVAGTVVTTSIPLLLMTVYLCEAGGFVLLSKFLFYLWTTIVYSSEFTECATLTSILAKLLPPWLQSFGDALRAFIKSFSVTAVGLFLTVWFNNIYIVSAILPFPVIICLSLIVYRGVEFRNPTLQSF